MQCDHKKSDMTPCVLEDGPVAYAGDASNNPTVCVGCERPKAEIDAILAAGADTPAEQADPPESASD